MREADGERCGAGGCWCARAGVAAGEVFRATATPGEIIAFCRDRLAHYKCPDTIQFGPLPKTSTGKIQKFVLRTHEQTTPDNPISGA
jgi:acyl-CoA synthetase (AMP-forming)/AMP-acid ligase II